MKPNRNDLFEQEIADLAKAAKLDNWTSFVTALDVPGDLAPALLANRPELVRLVKPRGLDAGEHRAYLDLIAGLIETNVALRRHAAGVANLVDRWADSFTALRSLGDKIGRYANFKHAPEEADDEGALVD